METQDALNHQLNLGRSSDLSIPLSFKLDSLEGKRPTKPLSYLLEHPEARFVGVHSSRPSDLYITVQLYAGNKPMTIEFQTPHKRFPASSKGPIDSYTWSQPMTLPVPIKLLPLDAQLAITIWDTAGPSTGPTSNGFKAIVGGTTLSLFSRKRTLRKGKQRCLVWQGSHADGSVHTNTPAKVKPDDGEADEMGRLEKLVKKYEGGDIKPLDWLDKLTFREIERIHAEESVKSNKLYLYVDLPRFDHPIIFHELEYPPPSLPLLSVPSSNTAQSTTTTLTSSASSHNPNAPAQSSSLANTVQYDVFKVVDPEICRPNPVEAKHRRLVRSHRSGALDRELKPETPQKRDELNEILLYPPTQPLTPDQRNMIWKYRFYLSKDKRALTKFLKSVVWSDLGEVEQAIDVLLPMWTAIDIDDALELLGPGEAFRDSRVRSYAVSVLARADDDELILYLLQLVQALKFDASASSAAVHQSVMASRHFNKRSSVTQNTHTQVTSLEDFLIERGVKNLVLGNKLHWYLMVECADRLTGKLYGKVVWRFMTRMLERPDGTAQRELLKRQGEFVATLSKLAKDLRSSKDARPKKIEKLKASINDQRAGLQHFAPLPLPLDARIEIVGIDADTSSVFKSNLYPLRLGLRQSDGSEFPVIFKNGDDLRQDQLVIQLFTLMERLLRKENLDLKLMPYQVLATGIADGIVQFVPSRTLGEISSEYGGQLLGYLRAHRPDTSSEITFGVEASVLDTYIRSCAGYCVVTYLLGVGDRHLDNLLLSPDGHFFHVDFGYILGRDPKPFPPAMKICKEMVDAMGGASSPHYLRFRNLCFTAFTILRKNANLIINLVALMVDANIPDIRLEPDKAVMKVQDKFRLDLSEEDAIRYFEGLLNETSSWAAVLDRLHAAAQYWRR
ncbi:uncharacterized protein L969DRAFT_92472 [Mixia osmundae IAM 14324]|uniref:Phosphatidylinositol 3-kinase VPS34 n=1 Tax=Mixia osmundae (strain CBS 9802 / IAM 14324 / JCM 22182 / KY 12970) TaxID=764103 RepID=G7DXF8_MIXOS|nr:uncharacterized protein L969DRAFT_92472 [Mixia osmundae IAM 14324]KEI41238.1 hypothetical protein L969DRAFT_92472 [Mixia osmundae IAM 14324]GAA95268.1 hypothetical protein E5Q_01924 [Mixia osmundae IAM 14324]